ncbi:hypothetical protein [Sorangium sp. So ce363]|uniref:hypothetical protein n=1 Tax=Sorangium sp. So ce363 TaxID=3133304 RepID=UPI003F625036
MDFHDRIDMAVAARGLCGREGRRQAQSFVAVIFIGSSTPRADAPGVKMVCAEVTAAATTTTVNPSVASSA